MRPASTVTAGLSTSTSDEFEDLDAMDFLRVGASRDKHGRPVVVVIARNFHPHAVPRDRLQRYILHRCSEVTQEPYTLAWLHTRATYWENCPSIWWLWRAYESLPVHYRANLASAYVLHCDTAMWAASMLVLPWLSGLLWRKIVWIGRVEFLWDYVSKVPLPAFVLEHDELLEDQPLTDYGIHATKELAATGMVNPI